MTRFFKHIILFVVIFFLFSCDSNMDRRIKLASKPNSALMQDRISTIQFEASQKKSIAIYHFLNRTGDTNLNWLESGIVEMLTSELAQSRQLIIIPGLQINEAMQNLDINSYAIQDSITGSNLAKQINAQVFINGQFRYASDSLYIDLELREGTSGRLLQKVIEAGGGLENVFSMINRISNLLRENLQINLSALNEIDVNKGDLTFQSLEAFKFYSQGMKLQNQLYYEKAFEQFQKAVEIDSTFASAYIRLAEYYGMRRNVERRKAMLEKAARYAANAPPKEKLRILGAKAITDGDIFQAIKYYEQLVDQFPEDADAHFQLANFYQFQIGRSEKAIEQYEATIALDPDFKLAYNHLGYAYADIGKIDLAYAALQKYIDIAQDEPNPLDSYGELLLEQGELDRAIEMFEKSLDIDKDFYPAANHLVTAYLDKGDTRKAHKIVKELIEKQGPIELNVNPYLLLANTYIVEKKFNKVIEVLEDILEQQPEHFNALLALLIVDPENIENRKRIESIYDKFLNSESLENITPNMIFIMVRFAFTIDDYYKKTDQLLTMLLEKTKDPMINISALAFKEILYNDGYIDEYNSFIIDFDEIITTALNQMTNITWDNYWRYYFDGIKQGYYNGRLNQENIEKLLAFSKTIENRHFEISMMMALASIHYYKQEFKDYNEIVKRTGSPPSSEWKYFGPYDIEKGVNQQFYPEENELNELYHNDNEGFLISDSDALYDGFIDLKKIGDAHYNNAVYAVLPVWVPSSRTAELRLGPTSPIKVWLNNRKVVTQNEYQQPILDRLRTKINLNAGQNYIMVKASNRIGEMGLYFRITDESGYGFNDIEFTEKNETVAISYN